MANKYVFVIGGVYSGIGKGIACASMAYLMKLRGHKVNCIKLDPYLNTSASCLSPQEHGEVWVTEDGMEADLDLGSYERIAGIEVTEQNIFTSGHFYKELIHKHEMGEFLGQTLQVVPQFTNLVQETIIDASKDCEISFIEIGGTVRDLESGGFYESVRQFKQENDCLIIMISPIIWVDTIKEYKTKPLQNAVKDLQSSGLHPDMLFCRIDKTPSPKIINKISKLTSIPEGNIFDAPDVRSIYEVPVEFYKRNVDRVIAEKFYLKRSECKIEKYENLVKKSMSPNLPTVNIGIFGKYNNCDEAYTSLKEALFHASVENDVRVEIKWIPAEALEKHTLGPVDHIFENLHGIIVPGGFDGRGVEGKIKAIQYVREHQIPFLGICLGLQCAVIEFARNVCKFEDVNSAEFDNKAKYQVIHYVDGQEGLTQKSGTMRLGAYKCELTPGSLAHSLYGKETISERHRHRYEVNEKYVPDMKSHGFEVSGRNPESSLVEMMELPKHPYFIATQAHPEFQSKLGSAAPLFRGLIEASSAKRKELDTKSDDEDKQFLKDLINLGSK
jgi:CTP synthase